MKHSWTTYFYRFYLLALFLLLLPVLRNRVEPSLRGVIWSDAEGYYVYLPGVFNLPSVHAIPEGSMAPIRNDKGEMVVKYTCGVAMFQLPFFLAARAYCDARGIDRADIYNIHYARAVALAGYMAAFLGLFFLQKILRRWFSEPVVLLTLISILGGTNLFYYATKEMGMSHAYSFCLFAFLAWQMPRFLERPSWTNAALLGGALGWTVLIRPTNVLVLVFLLGYEIYSWRQLGERLRFLGRHLPQLAVAAAAAALFFLPQMWYWHEMTGHWIRYSYTDEGFPYWNKPKIAEVLFDPQNGLFLYSPIVLLAVAGLIPAWRQKRLSAPAIAVVFVLGTYIFASWWAWWFGGAFGHRSYVELYALLALPMALCIEGLLRIRRPALRGVAISLLLFLVYYGVQMSFLYTRLPRPWDGPDWRWNWDKIVWVWSHLFEF